MNHLTPAEIVDAAEGTRGPATSEHLQGCERCRDEVSRASAMLASVRADETPEPSPLFWEHFSRRVREQIDLAPAPKGGLINLGRWMWAPAGALVAVLAVAGALLLRGPQGNGQPGVMTPTGHPAPVANLQSDQTEDGSWAILAESADGFEWEEAGATEFMVRPGAAERAAMQLSDDQREELARLLREEMGRLKS